MKNIMRKSKIIFCVVLVFCLSANVFALFDLTKYENKVFLVRNPLNFLSRIVKIDGTTVLKSMSRKENIGFIENVNSDEPQYISKAIVGDRIIVSTESYIVDNKQETYVYKNASVENQIYDSEGNLLASFETNNIPRYVINNKIIIDAFEEEDPKDQLKIYNIETKEIEPAPHRVVSLFNNYLLFSSSLYDDDSKEILIYDNNFNLVKTIKDYVFEGISNINKKQFVMIKKMIKNTNNSNDNTNTETTVYNYLDDQFEILFEKDVLNYVYESKEDVVEFNQDGNLYKYDFLNKQQIETDSKYIIKKDTYEYLNELKSKYRATASIIFNNNQDKYDIVDPIIYQDKILYLGYKYGYYDDNDEYVEITSTDVLDNNGKILSTFDKVTNTYETEGYIFVNNDTVLDFDLNIIKKFDKKVNLFQNKKFDRVFYVDMYDETYNTNEKYNVYDEKFNLLFENINEFNVYVFEDNIMVANDEKTFLVDKNLNEVKSVNKTISINDWNSEYTYKSFIDKKTNRMGIIDNDLNVLVDNMKSIIDLEKDYFTFQNGFKYGLMDYDKNIIIDF